MKKETLRRFEATEKTLRRFRDKPFSWAKGQTCLHLARWQLVNMGHRPPKIPMIRSAIGARRALIANGWDDVDDMLDSILERKPAAAARLGDLAVVKGTDGFGAIFVNSGNKWLGWHEDHKGLVPQIVLEFRGVWNV